MLNAPAGVVRAIARLRPTPSDRSTRAARFHRSSLGAAKSLSTRIATLAHLAQLAPRPNGRPRPITLRRALRVRLASERMLPIVAAIVVLVASFISFQPVAAQPTGGTTGVGSQPRLAVGGGSSQLDRAERQAFGGASTSNGIPIDTTGRPMGTIADDGTVWKPVAVDTTVADGRGLLATYTVQSGDTLTGIAANYGLSMMTLWWANKLTAKDELHVGQKLVIPPVDGLVVTVQAGDTLDSVAAEYKVDAAQILAVNGLKDPTLIVGQVLTLPGAAGDPIPTPKPVRVPTRSSSCSSCGPVNYSGGRFVWPVIGQNYISQYFHYGHYALDIAAPYGSPVVAAAAGVVTFAGWRSNGGGYQVYISHGSGLFTTYNHLSAILVSVGQSVGAGEQVGQIGQSGNATGPHVHFEVWLGPVWNGGTRVNPLQYY